MSKTAESSTMTHTGAAYFKRITALELNRRVRSAFQDLVLRHAPPGAALFDFGAGPGIDARYLAERGFAVDAYDIDPEMREFFSAHCRDLMDAGRITLDGGDYREFLARGTARSGRRIDLIISNFAPINQVEHLAELFAGFHAMTTSSGMVLASVLNPYFIRDMKSPWWWRQLPRLWRDGHFLVSGGQAPPHTRRSLADFSALCAPYFRLTRVFRGLPPTRARDGDGFDVSRGERPAWMHLANCQFMILLFEKQQ